MRASVGASATLIAMAGVAAYGCATVFAASTTKDTFAAYLGKTCSGTIIRTFNSDTFALAQDGSGVVHHQFRRGWLPDTPLEKGAIFTLAPKTGKYPGAIPTFDGGGHIYYKPLSNNKLAVEVRWDRGPTQGGTYTCTPTQSAK